MSDKSDKEIMDDLNTSPLSLISTYQLKANKETSDLNCVMYDTDDSRIFSVTYTKIHSQQP